MSTIFGDVVLPPISIIVHWALILGYPLLGESTLGAMGLEDQEVDEIGPAIIISMLMGLGRHQLLLPHSLSKGPTPPAPARGHLAVQRPRSVQRPSLTVSRDLGAEVDDDDDGDGDDDVHLCVCVWVCGGGMGAAEADIE